MSTQSACLKKHTLPKYGSHKLYLVSSKVCTTAGAANKLTDRKTDEQTFGETIPVSLWSVHPDVCKGHCYGN